MNALAVGFALLTPIVMGFLVVSLCWPEKEMTRPFLWCKLCLSVGIGFGISSFTSFFTLLWAGSTHRLVTFFFETGLICLLLALLWRKKQALFPSLLRRHEEPTTLSRILAWAFYVSLLLAISVFVLRSIENPHGEPDAFYLWNACARFLFRSGELWKTTFSAHTWSHPDYPMLLPANIVRLWGYWGKETLTSPILIAYFFTFATVGLLVSSLTYFRGRSQGFIGGMIIVSTPFFIKHGAAQYADVPLSYFILAVIVLVNAIDQASHRTAGLWCLIGLTLGFLAWTKNEGALFLINIIFARIIAYVFLPSPVLRSHREIFGIFLGGIPVLTSVFYFKLAIAPSNDIITLHNLQHLLRNLDDFSRYLIIGKAYVRQMIEPYSLIYSTPIVIFFLYALFSGLRMSQLKHAGMITSFFAVILTLSGYFFIYVLTPHDLFWHLSTSLSRLWLQCWPGIIFLMLMAINTPEEAVSRKTLQGRL